jgi:hypothetical protein
MAAEAVASAFPSIHGVLNVKKTKQLTTAPVT